MIPYRPFAENRHVLCLPGKAIQPEAGVSTGREKQASPHLLFPGKILTQYPNCDLPLM